MHTQKTIISSILLFICLFLAVHLIRTSAFQKRSWLKKDAPAKYKLLDNGLFFDIESNESEVSKILQSKNILLNDSDIVIPAKNDHVAPFSTIIIQRAFKVIIQVDGSSRTIYAHGKTVMDAIKEANITLGHADKVNFELEKMLEENMLIKITRINVENMVVTEEIPFEVIEKEDPQMIWKKKVVKQEGENGKKEKIFQVTYTNGVETEKKLISQKIIEKPIPKIEFFGTKIVAEKTVHGLATWYENGDNLTCAARDFSFGKYLRVTNKANGKSVIVEVNDIGPFGKDRVVDLNKKAFLKIAPLESGVINVKVEEIKQ